MPVTSTLLDQAHNAIERKLFAMKGFHHPDGSQQAFLTGLAHLYNLIPYQRRAKHLPASVGANRKEAQSLPETGCSISRSSPQEAFDEWERHTPPLNSVECGMGDCARAPWARRKVKKPCIPRLGRSR